MCTVKIHASNTVQLTLSSSLWSSSWSLWWILGLVCVTCSSLRLWGWSTTVRRCWWWWWWWWWCCCCCWLWGNWCGMCWCRTVRIVSMYWYMRTAAAILSVAHYINLGLEVNTLVTSKVKAEEIWIWYRTNEGFGFLSFMGTRTPSCTH